MLKVEKPIVASPKQNPSESGSSLFPYYAGFSEAFVSSALLAVQAELDEVVLDPWNGSGTTTTVASRLGFSTVGVDLNPALAIVAKSRLATKSNLDSAQKQLETQKGRLTIPLLKELCRNPYSSVSRSVILLAIFRAVRKILRTHNVTPSNPTWWRTDLSDVRDAICSIPTTQLVADIEALRALMPDRAYNRGSARLIRGDILTASVPKSPVGVILTSPPYLTRIDYVKATLPELLVLSHLETLQIDTLRLRMIGTSVVGRGPQFVPIDIGAYAKSTLSRISLHTSKASDSYYLAFFTSYIERMFFAFQRLRSFSDKRTRLVLVVQGSYYKEMYIDLSRLCIELLSAAGFSLKGREDFGFKQSFSHLNPRANGYNVETAKETVLFFDCHS